MEDIEFDAAMKDIDDTIAALTKVIDNIKALEHEKDPRQFPIF